MKMRVLVGGASGLLGQALCQALERRGDTVLTLSRADTGIRWDPTHYTFDDPDALEDFDAVVHLGGASIASRWTTAKKERIYSSRIRSTQSLATTLAQRRRRPATLLVASGIGYYGSRGDTWLREGQERGNGFLADVCEAWEAAALPARAAGIRVVHTRFGVVLSERGGALPRMLPPFRWGLGGRLGDGRQYMSWIDLRDAVAALLHSLDTIALEGPVNVVTPSPCTNREFTRALGQALRRPAFLPIPASALRLLLGEMGEELLLASQRAQPAKLEAHGFSFQFPLLPACLNDLLSRA